MTAEQADALLAAMKKKYNDVPRNLNPPFSREAAMDYTKAIVILRDSMPKDADFMESIDYSKLTGANAGNQRYFDSQRKSLLSRLRDYAPKEIERSTKYSRDSLKSNATLQLKFLQRGAEVDLSDRSAVATHLSESLVKQRNETFRKTLDTIDVALFFDKQLGSGETDYAALKKQVTGWQQKHKENLSKAAGSIKPPKGIENEELQAIAQKVLTDPKYKLPTAKRMIVNTRKRSQQRVEYEVEDNTIKRIERVWEEFQVATIEPKDGKYYIYFNTLKYFTKGASTTPLEKWVLGERFQSAPILEENIGG